MFYKATFFFTQRKWGWSETWYWNKATIDEALTVARSTVPRRVALLGGGAGPDETAPHLRAIRVSDVLIQRDAKVERISFIDGRPFNPLGTAENPNLALNLRIEGGPLYRRQLYLRGFPDLISDANGAYRPSDAFRIALNMYGTQMRDSDASILVTSRTLHPSLLISAFANEGLDTVLVTTNVPHTYATGDSVRIVSAPGIIGVRGIWRITVLDATNFRLMGSHVADVAMNYLGGGRVYKRAAELVPITSVQPVDLTHRVTGRPFDSPVGIRRVAGRA